MHVRRTGSNSNSAGFGIVTLKFIPYSSLTDLWRVSRSAERAADPRISNSPHLRRRRLTLSQFEFQGACAHILLSTITVAYCGYPHDPTAYDTFRGRSRGSRGTRLKMGAYVGWAATPPLRLTTTNATTQVSRQYPVSMQRQQQLQHVG